MADPADTKDEDEPFITFYEWASASDCQAFDGEFSLPLQRRKTVRTRGAIGKAHTNKKNG
jgi:hypothetical protein